MFKVGQRVHCETYGEGVVVDVSVDNGHHEWYTRDGRIFKDTLETHLTPKE